MPSAPSKPSVLVVLATGKMGSGIADAFVASKTYHVFGTSRNPHHPKLLGISQIEFEFGNKESMVRALKVSQASVVVIITDLINVAKRREIEVEHATIMMDACAQASTKPHVILCSNSACEYAPDEAQHLVSKHDMQVYLQQKSGIETWTILRPGSFFENYDDPSVMNPLKRGHLADLYLPNCKVPLVATRDIGTAAVQVANNPKKWNKQSLDCIASFQSGNECACVLTEVSGVLCYYKQSPPPFILKFFLPTLHHMVQYTAAGSLGYNVQTSIQKFRSVVPNAMGPKEWFESKGQWSDGTKFGEPAPSSNNNVLVYLMLSMPILIIAIVVALEMQKQ